MKWTYNRNEQVYMRRDAEGRDRGQVWRSPTSRDHRGGKWRYTGLVRSEQGVETMALAKALCIDARSQLVPNYGPSVEAEERIRRAGLTVEQRGGVYVSTLMGTYGPFTDAAEAIRNPIISQQVRSHEGARLDMGLEPADVAVVSDIIQPTATSDPVTPDEALRTAAKLCRYAFASDFNYRAWFHPADTPHCNTAGEINVETVADLLDAIAKAGGLG